MTRGTLEGLESMQPEGYGLGLRHGGWLDEPEVGKAFVLYEDDNVPLRTSKVHSFRRFSPRELRFRTKNTTYVLLAEDPDAPPAE